MNIIIFASCNIYVIFHINWTVDNYAVVICMLCLFNVKHIFNAFIALLPYKYEFKVNLPCFLYSTGAWSVQQEHCTTGTNLLNFTRKLDPQKCIQLTYSNNLHLFSKYAHILTLSSANQSLVIGCRCFIFFSFNFAICGTYLNESCWE